MQFDPCLQLCGRLTPEMRQVFIGMGSTLINSLKERDSWVFAGRAGAANISLFEKVSDPVHRTLFYLCQKTLSILERAGSERV